LPIIGYEFVRSFGVVKPVAGGGIMPWTGEDYFCDAARAVVFDKPLHTMAPDVRLSDPHRRLFTNGVVARGQCEFTTPRSDHLERVARAVGQLRVRVGRQSARPLVDAGAGLARVYGEATRPKSSLAGAHDRDPQLLVPCPPLIVIERGTHGAGSGEANDVPAQVQMSYGWSSLQDSAVALWTITHTTTAGLDEVKRARRHAVRLHCELEAFAAVLRACRLGAIRVDESTALREYLYEGSKRLLRSTYEGLPHAELLRSIAASRETAREGELASMNETLRSLRPGASRMIFDALDVVEGKGGAPFTPDILIVNGEVHMSDNSINFGKNARVQGVVGHANTVVSTNIGDSKNAQLHSLVEQLIQQLRELSPQLDAGEAELSEVILEEASKDQPSPSRIKALLGSILSGVQRLGEAGMPVVQTVKGILDLFG
jgi:hypothetical protein